MGSSSSRDGRTSVFYGLERLSQVREGTTEAFIHDGRGSVAQTILGGAVTSWKRYGAFGEVTAGTDAHEKPFFGYDAEEQDPLTGLTYLRARYYDPASARFGVADTYLGNTFDPLTLNRYLYCASDPVNHVDPTGHRVRNVLASGIGRIISKMTPTGGTPINGNSFANLPGQMTIDSTLISPNASDAEKWAQAQHNTNRWLADQARKRGDTASAAYHAAKAAQYREQFTKLYCGTAERMRAVGNAMLEWSYIYGWIPIVGTVVEWNAYVAKGDVGMSALFSVLSLIEVLSLGGLSKVETTGKLIIGSGIKEARNEAIAKAAKSVDFQEFTTLKTNMSHAGLAKPEGYSSGAHHIVEKAHPNPFAEKSRDLLKKWEIDINNAANGVYLPTVKDATGSYHPSLHNSTYHRSVYERLSAATSRDEALEALYGIRKDLEAGLY